MSDKVAVAANDAGIFSAAGRQQPVSRERPEPTGDALAYCTPADVRNVYRLILGREPENDDVVFGSQRRLVLDLVRKTLRSAEFERTFRNALSGTGRLTQARQDPVLLETLSAWLEARFGVVDVTGKARSDWGTLLRLAYESHVVWPELFRLYGGQAAEYLTRLKSARNGALAEPKQFRGAIDSASTTRISGWAVYPDAPGTPPVLTFHFGSLYIGTAIADRFRRDLQEIEGGNGLCGFELRPLLPRGFIPDRALQLCVRENETGRVVLEAPVRGGSYEDIGELHRIALQIEKLEHQISEIRATLPRLESFRLFPIEGYGNLRAFFQPPRPQFHAVTKRRITISIIIPAFRTAAGLLEEAIESVLRQTYADWELVVVNDDPTDQDLSERISPWIDGDPRCHVHITPQNLGLGGAINFGIEHASGDYIALLDHDDELEPAALEWVHYAICASGAQIVYTDEDRYQSQIGTKVFHTPHFKPAFDYELLLQRNYICHFLCASRELMTSLGGFDTTLDGAQDHDFLLRACERLAPDEIVHVPLVLYHWRMSTTSFSNAGDNTELIEQRARWSVARHLERLDRPAEVQAHSDAYGDKIAFCNKIFWIPRASDARLGIIIPTRNMIGYLAPCIESLLGHAANPDRVEIVIVDNGSDDPAGIRYLDLVSGRPGIQILRSPGEFNWSKLNNFAASHVDATNLLFMNNDMVMLTKGFDQILAGLLEREDVGAVGCRLLYGNGSLQHAGVVLGPGGIAAHEGVGDSPVDGLHFDRTRIAHETSAVTGAFLACTRANFDKLRGFDEDRLKVAFNDVDFCLKIRAAELRIIYTPQITCYHYESMSRGIDTVDPLKAARMAAEADIVKTRWGTKLAADPYYNPHFSDDTPPFKAIRIPGLKSIEDHIRAQTGPSMAAPTDQLGR